MAPRLGRETSAKSGDSLNRTFGLMRSPGPIVTLQFNNGSNADPRALGFESLVITSRSVCLFMRRWLGPPKTGGRANASLIRLFLPVLLDMRFAGVVSVIASVARVTAGSVSVMGGFFPSN